MPASAIPVLICSQAVEPPAHRPGSRPSIGVKTDVDQSGRQSAARRGVESEPVERAGPISVQEHVRLRQQRSKAGAVALRGEDRGARRACRAITSGTTPGSSQPGGSIRRHFGAVAGQEAAGGSGPASTRVRSSTRKPSRGLPARDRTSSASRTSTPSARHGPAARPRRPALADACSHSAERAHFGSASARAHDSRFQLGLGPLAPPHSKRLPCRHARPERARPRPDDAERWYEALSNHLRLDSRRRSDPTAAARSNRLDAARSGTRSKSSGRSTVTAARRPCASRTSSAIDRHAAATAALATSLTGKAEGRPPEPVKTTSSGALVTPLTARHASSVRRPRKFGHL